MGGPSSEAAGGWAASGSAKPSLIGSMGSAVIMSNVVLPGVSMPAAYSVRKWRIGSI